MANDGNLLISLGELIDLAWTVPFSVGRSPQGLDVPLRVPVFFDRMSPAPVQAGAVVLAMGLDADDPAAIKLVEKVGHRSAAAVVFKTNRAFGDQILKASDESGVALLRIGLEVTWENLYEMLQTTLASPYLAIPEARGDDLYALANTLAAMVQAPVLIDDPYMRVLAYSVVDGSADSVRRDSILARDLSPEWRTRFEQDGTFGRLWSSNDIIRLEGVPDEAFAPRIAIAIRSGTSNLGAIWISQGERPFNEEDEQALRDVANSAVLPMLRYRLSNDASDRSHQSIVRSVLDGQASKDVVTRRLGFADRGYLIVAAIGVTSGCTDADILSTQLAQHLVELKIEEFSPGVLASALDGRILYVLMQYDAIPVLADTKLVMQRALAAVNGTLRTSLCAGIGALVSRLTAVPLSMAQATEALEVVAHGGTANPKDSVALYEEVHAATLVAVLTRLVDGRDEFGMKSLEHLCSLDKEQGTEYIPTLRAYFEALGDMNDAAKALHVHPNTLRYRMGRITQLSGLRLTNSVERFIAEFHIRCGIYGLTDPLDLRTYG